MTSATGRRTGFTLIEIMVVISLIVILVAALVANTLAVGQKAYISKTETLLRRIDLALGTYRDRAGFNPPDGLDATVTSREDEEIFSSACIYECLGRPLNVIKLGPGGRQIVERYSSPILTFRESEIEHRRVDPGAAAEIVDSWGVTVHYDRLEGESSYSMQDTADVHLNPPEYHPPDPREVEGAAMEIGVGQNPGTYDIWSHGPPGHSSPAGSESDMDEQAAECVSNWKKPKE